MTENKPKNRDFKAELSSFCEQYQFSNAEWAALLISAKRIKTEREEDDIAHMACNLQLREENGAPPRMLNQILGHRQK